jgi:hypothetical protein
LQTKNAHNFQNKGPCSLGIRKNEEVKVKTPLL